MQFSSKYGTAKATDKHENYYNYNRVIRKSIGRRIHLRESRRKPLDVKHIEKLLKWLFWVYIRKVRSTNKRKSLSK
jgi:hypothetical protein